MTAALIKIQTLGLFSFSDIWDGVVNAIKGLLDYTLWLVLYCAEVLLLFFVRIMEYMMMIFTGESDVTYDGESMSLISVFFNHRSVRSIYGGIALIGIVFAFGFAIIAVIRKVLDLRDKQQGMTLGVILGNLLKSILLIASMSAIMMVALTTTDVLLRQISAAVQLGERDAEGPDEIYFDETDFATMGRIINTLGNYSLNPSYRSRYNVNACYNAIRPELEKLGKKGVWTFHYDTDKNGQQVPDSWQSVLAPIARAHTYTYEVSMDSYNEQVSEAILNAMDTFKSNDHIYPLDYWERQDINSTNEVMRVPLDRVLFLAATMGTYNGGTAARNSIYDEHPSFYDALRYPYFSGEKDIYDYPTVRKDFNPSPFTTNYLIVYVGSIGILTEMLTIILTCGVRIFNLVAMYVASPLVIAVIPLDDGGKFKQWTTAFIVQLLGVVGMVLSLRLFLMFLPIIWSPDLEVMSIPVIGDLVTMLVKLVITYTALEAVGKVNGIFTGILADSAGMQAITAGSMRDTAERSIVGQKTGKMMGYDLMKGGSGGGGGGSNKKSTSEKVKENQKKRVAQRDAKRLQEDIKFAEAHGRHNSANGGGAVNQTQLKEMKDTLRHLQEGNGETSLSQARELARNDKYNDYADQSQQAKDDKANLKDPPIPRRIGGGGGGDDDDDLPDREN